MAARESEITALEETLGKRISSNRKRLKMTQETTRFECETAFGEDLQKIEPAHLTDGESSVSSGKPDPDAGVLIRIEFDANSGSITIRYV